jgi:hypothetical protein
MSGTGAGTGETGETPPPVANASASKGRGKDGAASSSAADKSKDEKTSPRRGGGSPKGRGKSKSPRKNKSASPKKQDSSPSNVQKEASASSAVSATITGQANSPETQKTSVGARFNFSQIVDQQKKSSTPAAPKAANATLNPTAKATLQPPKANPQPKTPTNEPFSMRDSLRIAAQEITQLRTVLAKNNIVVPRSRLVANDVKALLSSGQDVVLPHVKAKMDADAAAKSSAEAPAKKDSPKDAAADKEDQKPKAQPKIVDAKTEEAFLRETARLEHELSMVKGILLMQNLKINASVTHDSQAVEGMKEIDICGDANTLNYLMSVKQKLGLLRAQHELLRSDMLCLANEMNTARQWVEKCFAEAVDLQRDQVHGLQARLERLAKLLP